MRVRVPRKALRVDVPTSFLKLSPGEQLYVYDHGTTDEATGFTTEAGSTEVTYPLLANDDGSYDAWYETGETYDLYTPHDEDTEPWFPVAALDQEQLEAALETLPEFNVKLSGAVGDEATDDSAAIRTAIAAAKTAGGGIVDFPSGRYRMATAVTDANGLSHFLAVTGDDIYLRFAEDAWLVPEGTVNAVIMFIGWAKENPINEWDDHYWYSKTQYDLDGPVDKGATSITLSTAADAANFAAGDAVQIITGAVGHITTPDAEQNEVVSADDSTGVVELRWPTCKEYHQEYVASQNVLDGVTTGQSSRTSTSFACPLALVNIEDTTIRNVGAIAPKIDGTDAEGAAIKYYSVLGLDVIDLKSHGGVAGFAGRNVRWSNFVRPYCDLSEEASATFFIDYGHSTGCSDGLIDHPTMIARYEGISLELSEGASKITVVNPKHMCAETPATARPLAYGGRNRDCLILDPDFVNKPSGAGFLFVTSYDDHSGNVIRSPRLSNVLSGRGLAAGWRVEGQNSDPPMVAFASDYRSLKTPTYLEALQAVILDDDEGDDVYLGTVPVYAELVGITVRTLVAFNQTVTLDLGYTGATEVYANNLDVTSTGSKAYKIPTDTGMGYQSAAREFVARVTASGSAPTAGVLRICVWYIPGLINPIQ